MKGVGTIWLFVMGIAILQGIFRGEFWMSVVVGIMASIIVCGVYATGKAIRDTLKKKEEKIPNQLDL